LTQEKTFSAPRWDHPCGDSHQNARRCVRGRPPCAIQQFRRRCIRNRQTYSKLNTPPLPSGIYVTNYNCSVMMMQMLWC